ncbi:MAG: hypothetical protein Q4G25_04555 [Paracoccus sp. (in: a-proteobacteria)]|nr:hypothetical protein [Paracoccus sp. (in: a-proteobacteria)]
MKFVSAITAIVVATATATAAVAQDATPAPKVENAHRLLTILTADDPQTQLMAMVLTMNAIKAGAEAQMLLCGAAGDIALKEAPETATKGQPPMDASPQGLMKAMMDQNGLRVQTCAIYLPGKGADPSVLLDGVTPARPDAMGAEIVTPGTTVMSF